MLRAKGLNYIFHCFAPCLILFIDDVDTFNFLLSLVISFLISNQYFSCEYKELSFNKIFLIGAYYYLAIFPLFYSLKLFEATTFNSWDLTQTSFVVLTSLLGYLIGVSIFKYFTLHDNSSYIESFSFSHGIGTRDIDGFLIGLVTITNLTLIVFFSEIRTFFIFSTVITLLIYLKSSKFNYSLRVFFSTLIIFMSTTAIIFLSTSRSDLIKLVILMGFLYFFLNRRAIDLTKIASVVVILFLGGIFITINRSNTGLSLENSINVLFQSYEGIIGILMALGDIGIAFDNLIYLVTNTSFDEFLMGSSLIRPLFFLIPRTIWPGKPLDTQLLIVDERYGALSEFGGGTSQSITLVGELYWNLSVFGVFFGFFLIAIIIKNLDRILFNTRSLTTVYVLAVFSPFFFIIWRGAYSSELVYTLISIIPVFLTILFHKLLKELPIQNNKEL